MPQLRFLSLSASAASLSLFLFLSNATQATTYTNTASQTSIVLHERTETPSGYYMTTTEGRDWAGSIQITSVDESEDRRLYTGTFQNFTLGPDPRKACEGTISITRRSLDRHTRYQIDATWNVTGGESCDSIGETYSLNLLEPLPTADRDGNFTSATADTWQTETSGTGTWLRWRVVSSDGKLNCRESPNGAVQSVYSKQEEIQIEGRAVHAIVTDSQGQPWLWTNRGCYVRAHERYVQPVSLPW